MRTEQNQRDLLEAYAAEPDPIYLDAFRWLPVEPIERARIASDLGPRALEHLRNNSNLFVVGYDCPNLTDPSYTEWEEFLAAACARGCGLTYYFGKKNKALIDRFRKIAETVKARPGQIQIYMRDHKGQKFSETYAEQWKTFHFAVFENPKQLWIETNHPEGSTVAFNCYYLAPREASNEPLWDVCKSRFEMVTRECASLEFKS
jgi:hypothetical protein